MVHSEEDKKWRCKGKENSNDLQQGQLLTLLDLWTLKSVLPSWWYDNDFTLQDTVYSLKNG